MQTNLILVIKIKHIITVDQTQQKLQQHYDRVIHILKESAKRVGGDATLEARWEDNAT